MNIVTLVKQVPDTAQLSATVDGIKLMNEGGPRIVNPWDEYSLETGIRLKEDQGGTVTILCVGHPDATEVIKRGLAMGADEAVLISDPQLESSDSLATARVLAAAVGKLADIDLIIAGRSAIDGNTAATAVQLAALLDLPQLSYVAEIKAIDPAAKTVTAVRLTDAGRETVTSTLPAVISVVKEINDPRYPSFMGIRKASKKEIPTWGIADLGVEAGRVGLAGSQVSWPEVSLPPTNDAEVEIIEGSPEEAAKTLVDRLLADKVI